MRISDWSSDVCSSDLSSRLQALTDHGEKGAGIWTVTDIVAQDPICTIWQELRARYDGGRGAFGRVLDRQVPAQPATQCEKIRIPLNLRSEEHTSELQSLMRISYAVFCLKKNKNNTVQ